MNRAIQRRALQALLSLLAASLSAGTAAAPPPPEAGPMPLPPTPAEVTFHGGMFKVKQLAFAPDGKTLAACLRTRGEGKGKEEEVLKLYDLATLHERLRFSSAPDFPDSQVPGHWYKNHVLALTYSQDGRTIVTGDDLKVSLWDAATGERRPAFPKPLGVIWSLAYAPDGKSLAVTVEFRDPVVYDLATGQPRLTLRGDGINKIGYTYLIRALAYSPDGKVIATASTDSAVRLYDAADGRKLWTTTAPGNFYSVAFAPDGKTIAGGTDASTPTTTDCAVRLYDAATGRERAALLGHERQVCAVAFTADGKSLVSLGRGGDVRLWDVATSQLRAAFGRPGLAPECMALSPDGKTVALGGVYADRGNGVITLLEIDGDAFHLRKPGL